MSQNFNLRGWCDFTGCKRWNGKYLSSETGELDYEYLFLTSNPFDVRDYYPENQNNDSGVWSIVGSSRINWASMSESGTIEPPFRLYYTTNNIPSGPERQPKPGRGVYYNATGFWFRGWNVPQSVTGNITCDFYYNDNTTAPVISREVWWKYFPRVGFTNPPRILVVVVTEVELDTTKGDITPQYNGALTFGADVGNCFILPTYGFYNGSHYLDDLDTPPQAGRNVFSRSGYDLASLGFSPLSF